MNETQENRIQAFENAIRSELPMGTVLTRNELYQGMKPITGFVQWSVSLEPTEYFDTRTLVPTDAFINLVEQKARIHGVKRLGFNNTCTIFWGSP